MERLILNSPNIVDGLNQIHSIYPCTGYITFGVWIYLVPQYKPQNILMLGYGGGTTAGLIRMFHGDVPITAVDMLDCTEFNYYDVNLVQADAFKYVMDSKEHFDAVIIDLYQEGHYYPEPFIYQKEFADKLKKMANYIIIHSVVGDDISAYSDVKLLRKLKLNTTGKYDPEFHYFVINDIPSLPIR